MPRSIPILDEPLLRAALPPAEALAVIRQAYRDYGRTRSVLSEPESMTLSPPGSGFLFKLKGGFSPVHNLAGFRLVGFIGGELRSHCVLVDVATGELLALVEESWLHRLRTAATAAAAAGWLARTGARTLALVGTGRIADELPAMMRAALPVDVIRVWGRSPEAVEHFARRHQALGVTAAPTIEAALEGADVVVTVTAAPAPLLFGPQLAPGATVIALGGGPELDIGVLDASQRLVVDDFAFARTLGSVAGWIAGGRPSEAIEARVAADIGEIAIGARAGRSTDAEKLCVVLQGMASCDVALAAAAWGRVGQ